MVRKQWLVVLGGVACLVSAPFFSGLADEGHGMMMHGHMQGSHDQGEQDEHSAHYLKHLLKHAKEIGLTPEQISKVKALQLDFKRSEARLEADAKVAKLELQALMEDEQTDLTPIQAKVDQLKKAEAACLFTAIKSKRTAMALLTPDQREKDRAVHEQMKSGAQHGGGMGGMMGDMMGGMGGGGMSDGGHGGSGGGDHAGGAQGGGQHQH